MSFGTEKSFADTKQFRQCVLANTNARLGIILKSLNDEGGIRLSKQSGMISLLDSTYKAETPSTKYAMHLKAIAFESARFLCSTDQVVGDLIFDTTRGEFFSQNIASFLFPDNRFSQTDSTDTKVRNFYLSIIEAYFGGSTKANIEKSLYRFVEIPVILTENFLLEQSNFDAIIKKFTFDVSIDVEDPRIKDLNKLRSDIEFLLNIIKPAHTTYDTKFVFNESLDVFRQGCETVKDSFGNPVITHDGFDTKIKLGPNSICDTSHMDLYDYKYEDIRKNCDKLFSFAVDKEDITAQASPREVPSVIGGNWSVSDLSIYHTRFGPLGKANGQLADSVTDVKVYVDSVEVSVTGIFPLSAAFGLAAIPPSGSIVTVDYYFLKEYVGALITNDFDSVLNNWKNQSTEIPYKTVLFPANYSASSPIPLKKDYRYKGFDFFYTSSLNCPENLLYNEFSLRNRLNDALVFKSKDYDLGTYGTSLYDNTTPVPVSLDKKDVWSRLPFQQFRMPDLVTPNVDHRIEFLMNVHEDRLFGKIHYESYNPFFNALELDTKDNGGEKGILHPVCEDPVQGMFLDLALKFDDQYELIGDPYSVIIDEPVYATAPPSASAPSISGSCYYTLSGFTLNGYQLLNERVYYIKGIDPANQFYPYPPLMFITMRGHIVEGSVTSITNITRSISYDLTNIAIIKNKIIYLDPILNSNLEYSDDDIIEASFTSFDVMNASSEYVEINTAYGNPANLNFKSMVPIIDVARMENYTYFIPIIIRAGENDTLDFVDSTYVTTQCKLTPNSYLTPLSLLDLANDITVSISSVTTDVISCTYNAGVFTFNNATGNFQLLCSTGVGVSISPWKVLGFTAVNKIGNNIYSSDFIAETPAKYSDYDLTNKILTPFTPINIVAGVNDLVDFVDSNSLTLQCTLSPNTYSDFTSLLNLANDFKTKMLSLTTDDITCEYNLSTGAFIFINSTGAFSLLCASGAGVATSPWSDIGFSAVDRVGNTSYIGIGRASGRDIDLDESLPTNIALGINVNDLVFAAYTTHPDLPELRPENWLNYPRIRENVVVRNFKQYVDL